jgi:hypothetical protein
VLFAHKLSLLCSAVAILLKIMAGRLSRFNVYLILLVFCCGCQATRKKEASTLRLYHEVTPGPAGRSITVSVYRSDPVFVHVSDAPFLNEGDIAEASVVDAPGSFQIMIQYNRRGTWLLEQFTTQYKSRRMAIFSQFGDARWLAAPMITTRIGDGLLVFTPDATREEAERIVRGLSNVAKHVQKDNP